MTQLSQAEITEMQMEAEVLSGRLFDPTDYGWFRHAEDHGTPWDEVFEAGQSMRRLRPRSNDWK